MMVCYTRLCSVVTASALSGRVDDSVAVVNALVAVIQQHTE